MGGYGNQRGGDGRIADACDSKTQNRAGDGMVDADIRHLGRAEDRPSYPGGTDRRDRRGQPGAKRPCGLGHLL